MVERPGKTLVVSLGYFGMIFETQRKSPIRWHLMPCYKESNPA